MEESFLKDDGVFTLGALECHRRGCLARGFRHRRSIVQKLRQRRRSESAGSRSHSTRSASSGSMRAARRAGIQLARSATPITNTATSADRPRVPAGGSFPSTADDHAHATDPEREADDQADETEAQTAPHEQSDDLTALGTKRRANADLTDPLPHRERHHGVEADGREQERERAGPASGRDGGDHGTPFRRFDGRERSRGHDWQRRCCVGRRCANRRQQLFGRTVRADEQVTGRVHARHEDAHRDHPRRLARRWSHRPRRRRW